jgi:predicted transcriptional regulator
MPERFGGACHTQEEIADRVGITQQSVQEILQETAKLPLPVNLHNLDLAGVEGVLKKVLTKERVAAAEHATVSQITTFTYILITQLFVITLFYLCR